MCKGRHFSRAGTITFVKKCLSATVSDAGERNGGDAEVGSYVVLRHSPNNVGTFFEQFFVTLLRSVLYSGQKELLVGMEAIDELFLVTLSQGGITFYKFIEVFSANGCQLRWFYALQREKARSMFIQTVEGSNKIVFKEELEGYVFAFVIEEQPQATAVYKV